MDKSQTPPLLTVTFPVNVFVPVADVEVLTVPEIEDAPVTVNVWPFSVRVPAVSVKSPPIDHVPEVGPVTVPVVFIVKAPVMAIAVAVQEIPPPTVKVPVTSVGEQVSVLDEPSNFKLT